MIVLGNEEKWIALWRDTIRCDWEHGICTTNQAKCQISSDRISIFYYYVYIVFSCNSDQITWLFPQSKAICLVETPSAVHLHAFRDLGAFSSVHLSSYSPILEPHHSYQDPPSMSTINLCVIRVYWASMAIHHPEYKQRICSRELGKESALPIAGLRHMQSVNHFTVITAKAWKKTCYVPPDLQMTQSLKSLMHFLLSSLKWLWVVALLRSYSEQDDSQSTSFSPLQLLYYLSKSRETHLDNHSQGSYTIWFIEAITCNKVVYD